MARSAFGSGRRAVLPAIYDRLLEEGVAREEVGIHVDRAYIQLAKALGTSPTWGSKTKPQTKRRPKPPPLTPPVRLTDGRGVRV